MENSLDKQELMKMMNRTNLQHITTNEIINLVSKFNNLTPEAQKEMIKMFPELSNFLTEQGQTVKSELEATLKSDDESLKRTFNTYDKALDLNKDGKVQYSEMIKASLDNLNQLLENPDLSSEERKDIQNQQLELLKMYDDFNDKTLAHEKDILDMADKKDSEKRKNNTELFKIASTVVVALSAIGAYLLGGNSNKGKIS